MAARWFASAEPQGMASTVNTGSVGKAACSALNRTTRLGMPMLQRIC